MRNSQFVGFSWGTFWRPKERKSTVNLSMILIICSAEVSS